MKVMQGSQYAYASSLRRIIAYAIDWYIVSMLSILPINLIYSLVYHEINIQNTITGLPPVYALIACTAGLLLAGLYLIYLPYKTNGQTLGKKLTRLRIVRNDEKQMDLLTLVKRNGICLMMVEGAFYTCTIYFWETLDLLTSFSLASSILTIFTVISGASMVLCLIHRKHTMLHDVISHTTVILQPSASYQ